MVRICCMLPHGIRPMASWGPPLPSGSATSTMHGGPASSMAFEITMVSSAVCSQQPCLSLIHI
eukprot:6307800-Prorocentrum_lima.AAC.1